jgi:hypothetical protein
MKRWNRFGWSHCGNEELMNDRVFTFSYVRAMFITSWHLQIFINLKLRDISKMDKLKMRQVEDGQAENATS